MENIAKLIFIKITLSHLLESELGIYIFEWLFRLKKQKSQNVRKKN